jgi:hypothetical protein
VTQGFAAAADAIRNGSGQQATTDFEAIISRDAERRAAIAGDYAIRLQPDSNFQTKAVLFLGTVLGLIDYRRRRFGCVQRDGSRRELAEKSSPRQRRAISDAR